MRGAICFQHGNAAAYVRLGIDCLAPSFYEIGNKDELAWIWRALTDPSIRPEFWRIDSRVYLATSVA